MAKKERIPLDAEESSVVVSPDATCETPSPLAAACLEHDQLQEELDALGDPISRMREVAQKYEKTLAERNAIVREADETVRLAFLERDEADQRCNRVELPRMNEIRVQMQELERRIDALQKREQAEEQGS